MDVIMEAVNVPGIWVKKLEKPSIIPEYLLP